MLIYIRDKTNFWLTYYAKIDYSYLSDILRQASIKSLNNTLVIFYSRYQDCTDTGRSTGSWIVFYEGETIDYWTHVPGAVAHPGASSEYNAAWYAVIDLWNLIMISIELINMDPDIGP